MSSVVLDIVLVARIRGVLENYGGDMSDSILAALDAALGQPDELAALRDVEQAARELTDNWPNDAEWLSGGLHKRIDALQSALQRVAEVRGG